jgi:hypothetical protein
MPTKKNQLKLAEKVMSQVKTGQIVMKPKWYFVTGSLLMFSGIVALSVGTIFLVNLTAFSLRSHGPMASWRLQMMLNSFPWWAPMLAVVGVVLGVNLLKKYDFSYQKNFKLIVISFVLAVLATGFLIDKLGLNDYWQRRGEMRQIYQRLEAEGEFVRPRRRFN